jgi:hypothetical protein
LPSTATIIFAASSVNPAVVFRKDQAGVHDKINRLGWFGPGWLYACRESAFLTPGRPGGVKAMAEEEMKAELDRLRAENEALRRSSSKGLYLKVSEKGAVSVYGLGRFPVTLYKEQWIRLLGMTEDIQTFIQQNEAQLKTKTS